MEILKLSNEVIDQIAAGEVVDRPAHMVKELLENAVDAGASTIEVSISEGGRQVEIIDNGKGVLPADLPNVFHRHATSKITQANDLWDLHSFGFRGEALATISAVSQMTFASRRRGEKKGFEMKCDYGELSKVTEVSMAEGTRVFVDALFENIPARKKFLKSDSAEVTQIKNVVRSMAMSHPHIALKIKINGKLQFLWAATEDLRERVETVLGIPKLYEASFAYEGFQVEAIFSDPGTTARVSRQMWFFVQGRWVQDRTLQAAVMEAYRSLLMHGEYPYCMVHVQAPPDQVDVNIHPTKSQVKFLNQKEAFRSVHYCLRESLEKAPWMTLPEKSPSRDSETLVASIPTPANLEFAQPSFQKVQFQQKSASRNSSPVEAPIASRPSRAEPAVGMAALKAAARGLPDNSGGEAHGPLNHRPWSRLQVIGQVDLTYIVTQSEDQMILIDQHAAHERVAFERLMHSWKNREMETQGFLLPLSVDFEEPEMEGLLEHLPEIKSLGISIEQAGPTTMSIQSVPALIKETGVVRALKKLAHECVQLGGSFAIEKTVADIFATMACHSVVRAGQPLSQEQMEQLLLDMDEFPLSGFCPHGRSVSVEQSFVQLEKDFGRRA